MKNLLLAGLIGLSAQTTFALGIGLDLGLDVGLDLGSGIRVGQIATGGNGCPNGDVTLRHSEQGLTLYYSSEMIAGEDSEKRLERVSCNVRMPISVPKGFRVVAETKTQGFAWVDGDRVEVGTSLFSAGSPGSSIVEKPATGDFELAIAEQSVGLACGQDVILAVNTNATVVKKASSLNDSFVVVDKTVLKFRLERCD